MPKFLRGLLVALLLVLLLVAWLFLTPSQVDVPEVVAPASISESSADSVASNDAPSSGGLAEQASNANEHSPQPSGSDETTISSSGFNRAESGEAVDISAILEEARNHFAVARQAAQAGRPTDAARDALTAYGLAQRVAEAPEAQELMNEIRRALPAWSERANGAAGNLRQRRLLIQ